MLRRYKAALAEASRVSGYAANELEAASPGILVNGLSRSACQGRRVGTIIKPPCLTKAIIVEWGNGDSAHSEPFLGACNAVSKALL